MSHVLIVDDESEIASLIAEALDGYELTTAENGAQALLRATADRRHELRMGAQEVAEGFPWQHQQAAIAQRDHIRSSWAAQNQRHLAKELARAEPDHLGAGRLNFDGAGGDEIHGVAAFPASDQPFARKSDPGHQERLEVSTSSRVQFTE